MTDEHADTIYTILVEECGAPDSPGYRELFVAQFPVNCEEYRFMGQLGFGGKVRLQHDSLFVDYYPEDDAPSRRAIKERADKRLARFYQKHLQAA